MILIVTPDEMAAIDRDAPDPLETLVNRAGTAVGLATRRMLGGTYGRTVNLVAGKGNNGADGHVAADWLAGHGVAVRRFDANHLPAVLPAADVVIDAAYGTGFRGRWDPPDVGDAEVLAVDIPSGVDALTGAVNGRVLRATATVTFAAMKPGVLFEPGRSLAGDVTVVDIGLDASRARAWLVDRTDLTRWIHARPAGSHKWMRAVRVVAGSPGMTGAAHLAAAAAQRAGSGMVVLSSPGVTPAPPPEVVVKAASVDGWAGSVLDDLERFKALVVGPGLGRQSRTVSEVRHLVARAEVPAVIDGDGLFALAWSADGPADIIRKRRAATVLTPHDGEYEMLLGRRPDGDRIEAARRLAQATGAVVLLKGPTTVVADVDGRAAVVAAGDQRLATAGTGDVLSGIIGAVLASGLGAAAATAAGAWIHAEAAQLGSANGLVAGDIVERVPAVLDAISQGAVTAPSRPEPR